MSQELGPRVALALTPAIQPLEDQSQDGPVVAPGQFRVRYHAVVVPVTSQFPSQAAENHLQRPAPGLLQPVFHASQRTPILLLARLSLHDAMTGILARRGPVKVKAKEAKCSIALELPPVELHQPALLLRHTKMELRQTLGQRAQVSFGVLLRPRTRQSHHRRSA